MSDAENDRQRLNNLECSLLELNIKVGNKDKQQLTDKSILEEQEPTTPTNEETNDTNTKTIQNDPQLTKITMNQSILLSKLPTKTTSKLISISKPANEKVQIRFKSIGSINQIKPTVFKISKNSKFNSIIKFLELKIGLKVYCYLNNSVCPNPDEELGNLFDVFKVGDELIVSYCNTVAFG